MYVANLGIIVLSNSFDDIYYVINIVKRTYTNTYENRNNQSNPAHPSTATFAVLLQLFCTLSTELKTNSWLYCACTTYIAV